MAHLLWETVNHDSCRTPGRGWPSSAVVSRLQHLSGSGRSLGLLSGEEIWIPCGLGGFTLPSPLTKH